MTHRTHSSGSRQVFLLTGCASGIGKHLTGVLARAGHRVWASDVNDAALEQVSRQEGWANFQVERRRLDVRDPAAWQRVLDEVESRDGPLDVLLNIAGVVLPGWVHEQGPDQVQLHLEVNTYGVIFGSQAAAARMVPRRRGHIVNVGSLAAVAAVPGLALYSASKFAVRGFSLALSQELRPHGVAVTVICPDAVATPMVDLQVDYPQAALTFSGGRLLQVDDVAKVLLERVLPKRPLEVLLPRSRGWMAKLTSLWPSLATGVLPALRAKGAKRQARMKQAPTGSASAE